MKLYKSVCSILRLILLIGLSSGQPDDTFDYQGRHWLISDMWKRVSEEAKIIQGISLESPNNTNTQKQEKAGRLSGRLRRSARSFTTTWALGTPATSMSYAHQHECIKRTLRMYSEIAQITFHEKPGEASTTISFDPNFYKADGQLGSSHLHGRIVLNGRKKWACPIVDGSNDRYSINLQRAIMHYIGHNLGLTFSDRYTSIMHVVIYRPGELRADFDHLDIETIHQYYKPCVETFDMVTDIIQPVPSQPLPTTDTYFFLGDSMWKYDYMEGRAARGVSLTVSEVFPGLLPDTQAYAYIPLLDHHLFFKGDAVFKYDRAIGRVDPSFPRRISDMFPPKTGSSTTIPGDIDAAFFNEQDFLLYFFREDMVYVYDYLNMGPSGGCCERIRRFEEEFPTPYGKRLTGNVDSVFYSHYDNFMYFISGTDLWLNKAYSSWNPWDPTENNELHYIGSTAVFFANVCPVHNT